MNNPGDQQVPAIEMRGVTVSALQDPETVVLADVNWTVNAGEYWVIGGMQGSGKSDLLALAAGLMGPREGSYRLFGRDMPIFEDELLAERLRAGLVFDGGQLLHTLTVRENLALPLLYHREGGDQETRARVEAMLELVELPACADNTPGSLGRNLQKRVGLARALMLEPELLLLDNPLGGLDLRQANWWLGFLGRLAAGEVGPARKRVTIVVTAGDWRAWRDRATHFALLQDQRFLQVGGAAQLSGHTELLVKELLAESPRGN